MEYPIPYFSTWWQCFLCKQRQTGSLTWLHWLVCYVNSGVQCFCPTLMISSMLFLCFFDSVIRGCTSCSRVQMVSRDSVHRMMSSSNCQSLNHFCCDLKWMFESILDGNVCINQRLFPQRSLSELQEPEKGGKTVLVHGKM